jgi:hypothetical protein
VLLMALLYDEEAATGEPASGQHKNKLYVLDQVCLVSATNEPLLNSCAPAGCRLASRVQASQPGEGRNKAVAYSDIPVYACMYPLNQDKKSAV